MGHVGLARSAGLPEQLSGLGGLHRKYARLLDGKQPSLARPTPRLPLSTRGAPRSRCCRGSSQSLTQVFNQAFQQGRY